MVDAPSDAAEWRHPAARLDCDECGGLGTRVARDGPNAVALACTCLVVCPRCNDDGWVRTDDSSLRRCACANFAARRRAFDAAGVPARHATSTRASFVVSSKQQQAVMACVAAFLRRFEQGDRERGLVLWGGVGRGKTHLMAAIVRELMLGQGLKVAFIEFSDLVGQIKAGFEAGRSETSLMDPLVKVDVLAIDELGKGKASEFETNVIDGLISRRYNAMKPVLATTNFGPGPSGGAPSRNAASTALGAGGPAISLADRLRPQTLSRLFEVCDFVELTGEDWRRTHRSRPAGTGIR